jgi:hypothetical protein
MGVPFIMKIKFAPTSAMACVTAIVIPFAHSKRCNGVEQFDAMNVALSSLIDSSAAKGSKWLFSMGYDEVCCYKLLNLVSTFTAPHRHVKWYSYGIIHIGNHLASNHLSL